MSRLPLLCCALVLAAGSTSAADMTFKIATLVPEGTDWIRTMRQGSDTIEERTGGRVAFKFYTSAVQGTDNAVRRKMRIGQLHGGVFTSGGLRQFHDSAELYGLPMMFDTLDEVRYVRDRMDGKLRDALEEAGYVNFGFAGGGFAYLLSKKPIASRADMTGLKIWIPEGDDVARLASTALGIAPVTLPLTDVLTGLQTGLIDTVMGPPVGVIVMQWHTVVTHITDVRIAYIFGALVIDGRAFSRISEADQAVVREVMDAIYAEFDRQGMADDGSAFQALLDDGLTPVTPEAAEVERWRQLIAQSNEDAARKGVYDATLLGELRCHLEAYRSGAGNADCTP